MDPDNRAIDHPGSDLRDSSRRPYPNVLEIVNHGDGLTAEAVGDPRKTVVTSLAKLKGLRNVPHGELVDAKENQATSTTLQAESTCVIN